MPRFVLHWALFVGENRPPPDAIVHHRHRNDGAQR